MPDFPNPVTDSDSIIAEYDDALDCMRDLRGMGENNLLFARQKNFTSRTHLAAVAAHYHKHFSEGQSVTATFELVTMTGWKPE